ncbi:MAG: peptidoglycan-binding protein [Clostridia bacterium]|nr:peptidoglycan-binding protein [Clostridia bacterium]
MIPLELGTTSVYVEYITLALKRSGYLSEISQSYDETVRNAVISFQQANGLAADGIVGDQTYAALLPYLEGFRMVQITESDTLSSIAQQYGIAEGVLTTANPYVDWQTPQNIIITVPYDFDLVPTDVHYTYYLTEILTRGLVARYPFVKSFSIGLSVMGKNLTCLAMGDGNTQVFYNATHHANEWITTPVVFKFAEDYAKANAFDTNIGDVSARKLFQEKTLFIMPVVNPDGLDLVTKGMTDLYYLDIAARIASDYPTIPFPDGWKANILGTDLNLNYPAGWMNAREIKFAQGFVSPAPRDFVGTAPLSAPESRAVHNFTLDNDFALTISYHTQGNVIYWKYLDYEPENSRAIGEEMSRVSGYALELTPSASGYAGYKDWFILNYNRPGYTVEAGTGQNPLPITQFDEIYAANLPLMVTALDMAGA